MRCTARICSFMLSPSGFDLSTRPGLQPAEPTAILYGKRRPFRSTFFAISKNAEAAEVFSAAQTVEKAQESERGPQPFRIQIVVGIAVAPFPMAGATATEKSLLCRFCDQNPEDSSKIWKAVALLRFAQARPARQNPTDSRRRCRNLRNSSCSPRSGLQPAAGNPLDSLARCWPLRFSA